MYHGNFLLAILNAYRCIFFQNLKIDAIDKLILIKKLLLSIAKCSKDID